MLRGAASIAEFVLFSRREWGLYQRNVRFRVVTSIRGIGFDDMGHVLRILIVDSCPLLKWRHVLVTIVSVSKRCQK